MRLLHGLPRRRSGLLLPGRRRSGRGPPGADRRGPRTEPGRGPACVPRLRRRPVRLLHPRPRRRRARPGPSHSGRAGTRNSTTPPSARRSPATCAAAPATRRSSKRSGRRLPRCAPSNGAGGRRMNVRRARHRELRRRHGRRDRERIRVRASGDRRAASSPPWGPGPAPAGAPGRPPDRRHRLSGHSRAGQHPPSSVPVDLPRSGPGRDPVRLAHRAVSALGPDRRGRGGRRRGSRARPSRAHRMHDEHRPPLRLPARHGRPARRDDRGGRPDRAAIPPHPRFDGPRPIGRRTAARRRRGGHRRDPGRVAGRDRPLPRPVPGRRDPDRARTVFSVLRQQ